MSSVVSAYGFAAGEIVIEKKTGRRAEIQWFTQVYEWRTVDGRKRRVPINEYEFVYRWLEPAKGRSRTSTDNWNITHKSFKSRFQKAHAVS